MPNLPTHVQLAWRAAGRVGDARLIDRAGCYLLGATAPDVRIITRRPRIETHFFDLASGEFGDGQSGLLAAHPGLASPRTDSEAAFVAGYISHLVADETWITSMYRRHFGGSGSFDSPASAQLFDRAAQLSLDRACEGSVRELVPLIEQSRDESVFEETIGPLDQGTIAHWRSWVVEFLSSERPYSWRRLHHMAGRISGRDPDHPVHALAESFLSDVPGSLGQLHRRVSQADLDGYVEVTVDNLTAAVGSYLRSFARGQDS